MDSQQFDQFGDDVVGRLAPKLQQRQRVAEYILGSAGARAWAVAIPDLVAYLALDKVPVTLADRDDLCMLLKHLGQPLDDVDKLVVS